MVDILLGAYKSKKANMDTVQNAKANRNIEQIWKESPSVYSIDLEGQSNEAGQPVQPGPKIENQVPVNKGMFMIEPRGNFDPFFIAVESVEKVQRTSMNQFGQPGPVEQNQAPKIYSEEKA